MGLARKFDLDDRLEAYFATLRSSSLREALKRGAGNWQRCAAVTGSAMAMLTSASTAIIGSGIRDIRVERSRSVRAAKHFASSKNAPLLSAVRLAMVRRNSRERFFNGAGVQIGQASQAPPSITPGGVVPNDSTELQALQRAMADPAHLSAYR